MDRDSDIGTGGSKGTMPQPPAQVVPSITKEVMEAYYERERGCRSMKTQLVSNTLKACAEDELVRKEYKEMVRISTGQVAENYCFFFRVISEKNLFFNAQKK